MNELMIKIDGHMYYATPTKNIAEALEKLRGLLAGANIIIDNVSWEAVLRDENGNDISERIMWKG